MNYQSCQLIIRYSRDKGKMSSQKDYSDDCDDPSFSQRYGYNPNRKVFQMENMDESLCNRIWNCIYYEFMRDFAIQQRNFPYRGNNEFIDWFWLECLKRPIHAILDIHYNVVCETLCNEYKKLAWWEIYDVVEKVTKRENSPGLRIESFNKAINKILREEMAGYQLMGDKIVPLINEHEIAEVSRAIECPIESARTHIEKSLALMSDRKAPDYANSVKESICAVEAASQAIGNNKKTLGDGLKELESKIGLSGILRESISKLYGYANVTPGVRHGQEKIENVTFDEAKLFLILCSAWVNYLVSKAHTSGAAHFLMDESS